jgi:hypothetical protein
MTPQSDDASLILPAAQRLDPVGDRAATTHRIDHEIGEHRAITGPNAGHARHVARRPSEPNHLDAGLHLDALLFKHCPAKAPFDQRPPDPPEFSLHSC